MADDIPGEEAVEDAGGGGAEVRPGDVGAGEGAMGADGMVDPGEEKGAAGGLLARGGGGGALERAGIPAAGVGDFWSRAWADSS